MPLDPLALSPVGSEQQTEPISKKEADLPAYRYARALVESARSFHGSRLKSLNRNWDFLQGKDHWPKPATSAAAALDQWAFRGVVNWTYATVKTKAAMITSAEQNIFVDPLDEESDNYDRLLYKSATEHLLELARADAVGLDCYLSGSVTSVGVAMWSQKPDQLTGTAKLVLTPIKTSEFFPDPSCDDIESESCRFVVWGPELDMSTIRQMWPERSKDVKPEPRQVVGGFTYRPNDGDSHLISGNSGDFVVDQQNMLSSRKAHVYFVWQRDESVTEDLREIVLLQERPGYQCVSCGIAYEEDSADASEPCPTCGGQLENVSLPPKMGQEKVVKRAYPYGRLTVYSGETLLYDGENPYEVESVFPFSIYIHDRIPGQFYGTNDVDLLRSLQEAQNTTVGQLIDYVRLAVNGPFEYPIGAKSYTQLGNGPNERHPVPDHLAGKAHYVVPDGFNVQAWGALHGALYQHFQIVSGLGSIGFSQTSSPPISATEVEVANARLSDRMRGHAEAYSRFMSRLANIGMEMARQFWTDPVSVGVAMPDSELKSIEIEVAKLPRSSVRIEVNTQEAVKDKILGQNSIPIFTNPALMQSPYLGDVLAAIGHSPTRIKEILSKRSVQQEIAPAPPLGAEPPPELQGAA